MYEKVLNTSYVKMTKLEEVDGYTTWHFVIAMPVWFLSNRSIVATVYLEDMDDGSSVVMLSGQGNKKLTKSIQ